MKFFSRSSRRKKKDVLNWLQFVECTPFGDENAERSDIVCWVIPDYDVGSGGHTTIFRMISLLEKLGVKCAVNIEGKSKFSTGAQARADICARFFPIAAEVTLGRDNLPACKALVATGWNTAYTVRDFLACTHKFYFVQDFEPWFYPASSTHIFAENTYRFGFVGITAGQWLQQLLTNNYQMSCSAFSFSYDRDHYYFDPSSRHNQPRLFYYVRPGTPRRGLELALLALKLVAKKIPAAEIIMAGGDTTKLDIPFVHKSLGVLSVDALATLYRSCDVALVLSFTNLSLLPIELMASGCAVVSNRGPHVEWMLNDDNAVLCDATPEALAGALIRALTDREFREQKIQAGLKYAQSTSWEHEAAKVAAILGKND